MTDFLAEDWPIAAAALPFSGRTADGRSVTEAGPEVWREVLVEVADAGFDRIDLTDSWLRVGDLDARGLADFAAVAAAEGVVPTSVSAIRCSVIDRERGEANLAYSHRTLDAAAALGIETVSFGLHQALTPAQQAQLWFWTVEGHRDDPADWETAVARLRELGRHAADLGILVSLEMYEDTFLGTADSAVRLVTDIGMDNVGLNPDIGNLVRLHRPIEPWWEVVEKTLPYANFWHVKNYARDEDVARDLYTAVPAPMAYGLIDYRRAFRYAIEQGFQGVICVENYGGDGLTVCADNRDYLRRHVLPKRPGYTRGDSRVRQIGHARRGAS
ncbi:TIM barrel protein [Microbacterium sp. ET2]|uniref:sugar phosphate isomerase/epimerase family protein n=1 Tax=Microbacterium albipurpureum TaxID=3050384 RepID=UPI00259CA915|nr:TIM barrel protein [Microbacterium sp. ET2 (Ac-2212)]WJL96897.1 TIM barrel protein [Microbacterium sp. ET2 (Ac-2212)]